MRQRRRAEVGEEPAGRAAADPQNPTEPPLRLLERRFSHHRVADLLEAVDADTEEQRSKRPVGFKFEVPLDPRAVENRPKLAVDELNARSWGIDPRVNIEMYSRSMSNVNSSGGIDRVMTDAAQARKYLQRLQMQNASRG